MSKKKKKKFLGLARTSDRAVGTTSGGGRVTVTTRLGSISSSWSTNGRDLRVPHFNQGLAASVATRTTSLGRLVVGGNVEGDEQHQVGRDDDHASESSELFASTLACVGHVGEVGAGEVGVGGEVNEACIFN